MIGEAIYIRVFSQKKGGSYPRVPVPSDSFFRLAAAVRRQRALHTENSGFALQLWVSTFPRFVWTLENIKGAIKKNGQSRETGNTGHTKHRTKIKQQKTWYADKHKQHKQDTSPLRFLWIVHFFLLPLWCSLTFIYTCYSNGMLPGS
jgi:hypothetical protein